MRLSARGFTLPWQLVELQEPGPVYLLASAGGLAGGFAARAGFMEATKIAPSQTAAQRSVQRLASGPILILFDSDAARLFRAAVQPARARIFILPVRIEVNQSKIANFQSQRVDSCTAVPERFFLDSIEIFIVYTLIVFRWDTRKAAGNLEKHGVSFEEAATVFGDPEALEWEDLEHSHHENRFKRMGISLGGRVIILVYSYRRTKDGKETIRIITARRASPKEREAYAK